MQVTAAGARPTDTGRSYTAPTEFVVAGTAATLGVSAAIPSLIAKPRADRILLGAAALAVGSATGALAKRAVDGADASLDGGRSTAQLVLGVGSLGAGFAARSLAARMGGKGAIAVAGASTTLHLLATGVAVSAAADGVSRLAGRDWSNERPWSLDPKPILGAALVVGGGAVVAKRIVLPKLASSGARAADPVELAWLAERAGSLDARIAGAGGTFHRTIPLEDHDIHGLKFLAGRARIATPEGAPQPLLARVYDPIRHGMTDEQRLDDMVRQIVDNGLLKRAKAILVEVPTGSGAMNSARVRAFEHMHGGDTLILARQYSAKRSVESYPEAPRAGRMAAALIERLRPHLDELYPDGGAPPVFLDGESLGAGAMNAAKLDFHELGVRGVLQKGTPAEHAKLGVATNDTRSFHGLADVRAAAAAVSDFDQPALRSIQFRNADDPVAYVRPRDVFGGGERRPNAEFWQDRLPVTAGLKKILDLKNSTSYRNEPGVWPALRHHNYRLAAVDHDLLQLAFGTNASKSRLASMTDAGTDLKAAVTRDEVEFARHSTI